MSLFRPTFVVVRGGVTSSRLGRTATKTYRAANPYLATNTRTTAGTNATGAVREKGKGGGRIVVGSVLGLGALYIAAKENEDVNQAVKKYYPAAEQVFRDTDEALEHAGALVKDVARTADDVLENSGVKDVAQDCRRVVEDAYSTLRDVAALADDVIKATDPEEVEKEVVGGVLGAAAGGKVSDQEDGEKKKKTIVGSFVKQVVVPTVVVGLLMGMFNG